MKPEWKRITRRMAELAAENDRLEDRLREIRSRCKHVWHCFYRDKRRADWKCARCGDVKQTKGDKPS